MIMGLLIRFPYLAIDRSNIVPFCSCFSGKKCPNTVPITLNDEDRQLLYSKWHRIKCSSSFLCMSHGRIPKCSNWCEFFASRFNDENLAERCSIKFRRQLSWFQITADSTNTSFVTRILVRRCRPFWRSVFIFKVVKCNCSGSTNKDGA